MLATAHKLARPGQQQLPLGHPPSAICFGPKCFSTTIVVDAVAPSPVSAAIGQAVRSLGLADEQPNPVQSVAPVFVSTTV